MSEDNLDICGSIWNHELAMRRLLLLLRQSQSQCNDSECFQPTQPAQGDDGFMLVTLCWMLIAFVLYCMRPSTIRNRERIEKPDYNGNGSDGDSNPPTSPNAF